MAMIRDIASFSIKELGFSRVEPKTAFEWDLVDKYLLEKTGK